MRAARYSQDMDDMSGIPDLPVYGFRPDLGGLLGLLVTVVLPVVASLLMKRSWSRTVKGATVLGLAAVKTVLEAWLQSINTDAPFDWVPVVYSTALNFVVATIVYLGFLKGTAVNRAALDAGPIKD